MLLRVFVSSVALSLSFSASAFTQGENGGTIPGNRGELITPMVPGPPTYTGPEKHSDSKAAGATICEPPSRSYLDPRRARTAPQLDSATLYDGWLAGELLGEPVKGNEGHQLGRIQDILVGVDGRISAVTVEGGGFLEIGDAAFRVAWSKVRLTPDEPGITVNLSKAEAERAGLFEGPETIDTEPREFRITEVLGDWTRIGNETTPCYIKRGYVRDVIMDPDGDLLAILETRSSRLGGGTYAYPFLSYQAGWRPFYGYYDLPLENMSKPAPKVDLSRFGNM